MELYQEGIRAIQKYSGDLWTDYNEHDPGVTILEYLVFAISDLSFRMGFHVGDMLRDDKGDLNLLSQSLIPAEKALTSHPVTVDDFRRIVFDEFADLGNVWLEPRSSILDQPLGLYDIFLLTRPDIHFSASNETERAEIRERLKTKLLAKWPEWRNLGEDLASDGVHILEGQDITVHASLVVSSASSLEAILANVILNVDDYFNPQLLPRTYDDLIASGIAQEEIFEGPRVEQGFVTDESLAVPRPLKVTKSKLLAILSEIEGVSQVENLQMAVLSGKEEEKDEIYIQAGKIPRFRFELSRPKGKEAQRLVRRASIRYSTIKLRRRNSSKYLDISYEDTIKQLRAEQAKRHRLSSQKIHLGEPRFGQNMPISDFGNYYSIQNHFPYIYAINKYGLSKYEPASRRAETLQLKAYLLLFEQLLANYAAQIDNLKELYSDREITRTYFSHPLTKSEIDQIDHLYQLDKGQTTAEVIDLMLERVHALQPHITRKSRVLDYMLALYGETFHQSTLKRVQGVVASPAEQEIKVVQNKARMLQLLRHFNANSVKAPDHGTAYQEKSMSGFQMKVALLLDIDPEGLKFQEPIKSLLLKDDLKFDLVEAAELGKELYASWEEAVSVEQDFIRKHEKGFTKLTDFDKPPERILKAFSIQYTSLLSYHFLTGQLLRSGAALSNYRVYKKGLEYHLILKINDQKWYLVDTYSKLTSAVCTGYKYCGVLARYLSISERFLLIDHSALRPSTITKDSEVLKGKELDKRDFYGLSCSIIFPGWTGRFADTYFRQLAEETVSFNVPSHIISRVHWLDVHLYHDVESAYLSWVQEGGEDARKKLAQLIYNLQP